MSYLGIARESLHGWVDARRPDSGAMGVLYQQRPSLYWLIILVGVLAYVGLVTFLALCALLIAVSGFQAVTAALASWPDAYAWFGLSILSMLGLTGTVALAVRWASQYEVSE